MGGGRQEPGHVTEAVVSGHSPALLMFDVVEPVCSRGLDAYRRTWLEQFFPWHGRRRAGSIWST